MSEESAQVAMQLIYYAGNAKSLALQAIKFAETGAHDKAVEKLGESRKELHNAHAIQTDLMTKEMNHENIEKSILMIHAQDHFMSADTTINLADQFIKLYDRLERSA